MNVIIRRLNEFSQNTPKITLKPWTLSRGEWRGSVKTEKNKGTDARTRLSTSLSAVSVICHEPGKASSHASFAGQDITECLYPRPQKKKMPAKWSLTKLCINTQVDQPWVKDAASVNEDTRECCHDIECNWYDKLTALSVDPRTWFISVTLVRLVLDWTGDVASDVYIRNKWLTMTDNDSVPGVLTGWAGTNDD